MTARFTLDPPIASVDTWAGQQPPYHSGYHKWPVKSEDAREAQIEAIWHDCPDCGAPEAATRVFGFTCEHSKCPVYERRSAEIDGIFRTNMAWRDAAAAEYGEPQTPHEFYAGRPGSKAERIVCDCLRELRDIPEADRLYAHELTDAISAVYLDLAWAAPRQRHEEKIHRRTMALMRIAAGEK